MTKRSIDVENAPLDQAQQVTAAAMNAALRHAVEAELRFKHVRRLIQPEGIDIVDRGVMVTAWP